MKKRIQILLITFFFFMMNCVVEFSNLSAVSSGTQNTSLFTPSMPIHSINEQAIEKIYGASGLKFTSDIVTQIKQTYSYIESIVKAIKIKNDPTLKSSFSKYYSSQKSNASMLQDIMNSKEWSSVKVTNKEIQMSEFCQLYLKSMIVDYYDNQHDFIESISMVQNQMYPYLANIELNFYNNDFIKLRTFAELLRVEKILQDVVLQRYLAQSTDWKGKDPATLTANLTAFKATDFYKYTHDKSLWSNSPNTMSHPLYEYIMGYFMLVTIQSTVQNKMTQNNLFSFLAQASSSTISPNFFPYQSADVVAFDDIFTLQQASINVPKGSSSHKDGSQKTFDMKDLVDVSKVKSYGNTQNVVIQKKGKDPTGISGHAKHAGDDISNEATDAGNDISHEATDDTAAMEKEANDDTAALEKKANDDLAAAQKLADDQAAKLKKEADDEAAAEAQKAQQKIVEQEAYKQAADDAAAAKKDAQKAAADAQAAKKEADSITAKQLEDQAAVSSEQEAKNLAKKTGEEDVSKEAVEEGINKTEAAPITHQVESIKAQDFVTAGDQTAQFGDQVASNKDFATAVSASEKGLADAPQEITKENAVADKEIAKENAVADKNIVKENTVADKNIVKENTVADKNIAKTNAVADKNIAKGSQTAAITTGQGIQTAGVATGQGIQTAGVATGQGIQTAGVATGQGLQTAGVATGQGLQTAGVATGTTLEYTAAAAGQGAAGAVLIETGNVTGDQSVKNEGEKQKAQAAQDAKKAGLDTAAQGITTAATATGQGLKTAAITTGDTLEHASAAAGESLGGAILTGVSPAISTVVAGSEKVSGAALTGVGSGISTVAAGSEKVSGTALTGVGSGVSTVAQVGESASGNVLTVVGSLTGDETISQEGQKEKEQSDTLQAGQVVTKEGQKQKEQSDTLQAGQVITQEGQTQKDQAAQDASQIGQTVSNQGKKQKAQAAKDANATGYKQFDANVENAAQETATGTVDTGKAAVKGTVDTGQAAVKGTVDTGQAAVKGTVDTGQTAVKGTVDTGQAAVKGTVDTGQAAVKGTVDTGQAAVKGTVNTGQAAVTGVTQTAQDTVNLGKDMTTGAIKTTNDIDKSTTEGLKQTGKIAQSDIVGATNVSDFVDVGTAAASAVTHGATAAVEGIAGGAALAVGSELGIKSVTQWGNKETAQALQDAKQTDKAFNNTIANLAKFGLLGPIVYGVKGIVLGSVGLGGTMLGDIVYAQTGNSSIKNWGTQQNNDAINNIKKTGDSINNIIASTALVLEDGFVAPVALILGAGVGIITQNKQMGQDLTLVLNQILDSVINVGAVVFTTLVNLEDNLLVQIYKVGDSADELFVDAVMIAYSEVTNQKDVRSRSIAISSDTSKQLVKNTIAAVTSTISCVMSSGMDVMMSVAQVLAAVENSLTTIVFDLVDEITFLGASFGELMGAPINAKQERDKIDAKMEAHRGTINIVMSVVIMVAVTVATLGLAAPAAGAIEAAATVAAAEAAEAAAITAAEVAATAAAQAATEAAVMTAASEAAATAASEAAAVATEVGTEAAMQAAAAAAAEAEAAAAAATEAEAAAAAAAKEAATAAAEETAAKTLTITESILGRSTASLLGVYAADIIGQGINIVFSVFGIIGQENKDEAAITTLAQEKASIINLWQFIESNKVVMTQGQNIFLDELTKKHQSAIGNQTFGLNYYTNYLNNTINNMQSQISHALSQQYIQMLTPDDTGSKIADIGSSWGLITPFVYLYPSQGFLTTTLGRKNFPYAQEIAQAPLVAQSATSSSASKSLDSSSAQSSALWFNQRAVSIVDQAVNAPLNVEIKFRVIYNLSTEFHVGLYLGGKYYDYNSQEYLADIKNNGGIHLDDAHLAKMFVLKRDNGDKKPSIGVYENEGKGWILNKPLDNPSFNHAAICHMSATLHKNKLTVSVWTEDKPTSVWTNTVDVTPCDQKTFGLIFSGAAIEWDVVKPSKVIQQNAQVRTATTTPLEADRERAARKAWTQLRNPQFGAMKLASLGKKYLFQGQYVYSTNKTPLKDKNGTQLTDIVAFATFVAGSCTNIGSTPTPADTSTTPNAIISMINGDIYNPKGVVIGNQKDPWTLFTQSNGPFDQGLMDTVTKTQQACPPKPVAVSTQTISFDSFDVGDAPSVGGFEFGLSAPTDSGGSDESFGSLQLGAADGFSFDFGDFGDSF